MPRDVCWAAFNMSNSRFVSLYAVYHYFKSRGWRLRSGLNYGVDFVIYAPEGPAAAHGM